MCVPFGIIGRLKYHRNLKSIRLNGFLISNRRQAFNDRNLMARKVFIKLILYEDLLNGDEKKKSFRCLYWKSGPSMDPSPINIDP